MNYRKPKTKYFSISNSERNFEFINPKKSNIEIKGNMRQYKYPEETKEIQQFSSIYKYNLPNSKRTLLPSYQPINNQENINHKAFSFFSNKFNTNSVGRDFIPYEEPQVQMQRKSAAQIMQESSQPLNIRQLKPNDLHRKYVETSQISNIPGPDIVKRTESNSFFEDHKRTYFPYKSNNKQINLKRKSSYALRENDIESFQRKVFRDYNSNIACLPGVTINEKEKVRTLVATNSRKNESHISFGIDDDKENYRNNKKNNYDYNKNFYKLKKIPRPVSCSGKRIIRDKNKETNCLNQPYRINNSKNYQTNDSISGRQKYSVDKNKSQIIFG